MPSAQKQPHEITSNSLHTDNKLEIFWTKERVSNNTKKNLKI